MESNKNSSAFSAQFGKDVLGNFTQFVFHPFENKWLIVITQYGKLTNFYTITIEDRPFENMSNTSTMDDSKLHKPVPVDMTCIFGADNDEVKSCLQFLMNHSNLYKCPTELLISFGLKETNGPVLRELVSVINTIIK